VGVVCRFWMFQHLLPPSFRSVLFVVPYRLLAVSVVGSKASR
jgi:hypothetical protein